MGLSTTKFLVALSAVLLFTQPAYPAAIEGKEDGTRVGYCKSIDFVGSSTLTASGMDCTFTVASGSSAAAGSDTQVQFNDGGTNLGGDSGFTYNKTTNVLSVTGGVTAGASTGVSFTGSNGSVTLLGLGDGADEDIKFDLNTTANKLLLTSTTSMGTIDFGSIGVDLDSATTLLGTVTGAVDAGGATSLEMPNGTNPTVDAVGEFAWDTTDDQLIAYGSTIRIIPTIWEKGITLEDPVAADDNIPMWTPVDAITIQGLFAISQGSTATVQISDGTNLMEGVIADTNGESDDGTLVNNTFTAGETVYFSIADSSTASMVSTTVRYTVDRQ